MTRSTDSRRARNSASVTIEGRRRLRVAAVAAALPLGLDPGRALDPADAVVPAALRGFSDVDDRVRRVVRPSRRPWLRRHRRRHGGGACDVGFRSTYRRSSCCSASPVSASEDSSAASVASVEAPAVAASASAAPSSPESSRIRAPPPGRPPRPRRPRRRRVDDRGESSPSASSPGSAVSVRLVAAVTGLGGRRGGRLAAAPRGRSRRGGRRLEQYGGDGSRSRRRPAAVVRQPASAAVDAAAVALAARRRRGAGGWALLGRIRRWPASRLPVPSQPPRSARPSCGSARGSRRGIRRLVPGWGRRVGRRPGGARRRGARTGGRRRAGGGRRLGAAAGRWPRQLGGRCRLGRGRQTRCPMRVVGALVVEHVVSPFRYRERRSAPRAGARCRRCPAAGVRTAEADDGRCPGSAGLRVDVPSKCSPPTDRSADRSASPRRRVVQQSLRQPRHHWGDGRRQSGCSFATPSRHRPVEQRVLRAVRPGQVSHMPRCRARRRDPTRRQRPADSRSPTGRRRSGSRPWWAAAREPRSAPTAVRPPARPPPVRRRGAGSASTTPRSARRARDPPRALPRRPRGCRSRPAAQHRAQPGPRPGPGVRPARSRSTPPPTRRRWAPPRRTTAWDVG